MFRGGRGGRGRGGGGAPPPPREDKKKGKVPAKAAVVKTIEQLNAAADERRQVAGPLVDCAALPPLPPPRVHALLLLSVSRT